MISSPYHQRGLSLVELMVAVTLSLILTAGVFQIFYSSKQTSRVQDAMARLQENARFALDVLSHDIRMAGQLGCNSNANINYAGDLENHGASIFGYEQSANPDIQLLSGEDISTPADWTTVSDTDAIIVISATPNSIPIKAVGANNIQVDNAGLINDISEGDPLLISDCVNADLAIAGTRDGNSLNVITSSTYTTGAELARLNYIAYRVLRNTTTGYRNLHRAYLNAQTGNISVDQEPLLEGVENFQIFYGITTNDNKIKYVSATEVNSNNDWPNVSSVRIHLLLSTLDDGLATEPQDYWYVKPEVVEDSVVDNCPDGEAGIDTVTLCHADDNDNNKDLRLYRSFTTTIQLRNHGIGI